MNVKKGPAPGKQEDPKEFTGRITLERDEH